MLSAGESLASFVTIISACFLLSACITAERNGDVNIVDVFSMQNNYVHTVKSVRISPNNKYIAAGASGTKGVRVWRVVRCPS